jgi:hypothetical protein
VYDCAALAVDVQREVFGRPVVIPGERPDDPAASAALLAAVQADHAQRIDAPHEGAIVLMRRGTLARPWHVGTWFELAGDAWVLHTTRTAGAATVARVRDLGRFGFQIEGYYTWV